MSTITAGTPATKKAGIVGKILVGFVAGIALVAGIGVVTGGSSAAPAPVASSTASSWEEWSYVNADRVRAASDSMRDVQAAAGEMDATGVSIGLRSSSSSLLAIDETPDAGVTSSKLHEAGRLHLRASELADDGDIEAAAILVGDATAIIRDATASVRAAVGR